MIRFKKNSVERFKRYTEKRLKSKFRIKLHLNRCCGNMFSFHDHNKAGKYTKISMHRNMPSDVA